MIKFALPMIAVLAAAPSLAASKTAQPLAFERDGIHYIATVRTEGATTFISGNEVESGKHFDLRYINGRIAAHHHPSRRGGGGGAAPPPIPAVQRIHAAPQTAVSDRSDPFALSVSKPVLSACLRQAVEGDYFPVSAGPKQDGASTSLARTERRWFRLIGIAPRRRVPIT